MADPIAFEAEVRQVRTMVDGSVNILLNLPEYCREEAKRFMDWHGLVVALSAVAIEPGMEQVGTQEHLKKRWRETETA